MLSATVTVNQTNISFVQPSDVSITELNKNLYSSAVLVKVNQATSFNHLNQVSPDYIFVALITLFLIAVVNYQYFKPSILPPPWYMVLRHSSHIYISGYKFSNVQYKTKLSYLY